MPPNIKCPEIPLNILDVILPKKNILVLDFLNFCLPGIARESSSPLHPKSFFSTQNANTTDIRKIQQIPLPPLPILKLLLQATELRDSQSIVCQHIPDLAGLHFPPWIVTYWAEAARIGTVMNKWILAEEAMELQKKAKHQTEETKDLITRVYNALATISWSSTIQGFPGSVPVEYLAAYMTKEWLTDEHENQMLHLLGLELASSGEGNSDSERIYIAEATFVPSLIRVYKKTDRTNQYATAPNYNWLRKKGQEFGTGILDKLATITNVGRNHWVAVVIDFRSLQILYGDSLGGTITEEIEMVLNWWIHHHTGQQFTMNRLPITRQRDGYSCGIMAWNAVATKVLPKNYMLIKSEDVADERLRIFLRVSERHNDKVSYYFEN
jgi:Ulp1 family protease catalytic subunit